MASRMKWLCAGTSLIESKEGFSGSVPKLVLLSIHDF